MELTIGFSPCPNDTFIFDALIHQKVDTEGLQFRPHLADVEELNRLAFQGTLPITKLSYHALGHLIDRYALLESGSALGRNCGPLLIARTPLEASQLADAKVAIPGKYTTANFLFSLAYPQVVQKEELLFSEIEQVVVDGRADAGVIIHENRFTYQNKGLVKIRDLGEYWESTTGYPIPLGGIVVRRDLPRDIQHTIDRVLRRSVTYAQEHPEASRTYVRAHAQEMDEAVMYAHIDLYVNEFTRQLGTEGREAVLHLFKEAQQKGIIPKINQELFIR